MFEFSVSKYMRNNGYSKGGGSREGSGTLCLILTVKELKISVKHGRVVTTLNILYSVAMIFSVTISNGLAQH